MEIPGGGDLKQKSPPWIFFWNYTLRSNPPIPGKDTTTLPAGVYAPHSFRTVVWVMYIPLEPAKWKSCEMGSTGFFYSNPRILESLTICRCHYKDSTFFSVILIKKEKWSSGLGLNPRCPAKLTCALPTELTMRWLAFTLLKQLVCILQVN